MRVRLLGGAQQRQAQRVLVARVPVLAVVQQRNAVSAIRSSINPNEVYEVHDTSIGTRKERGLTRIRTDPPIAVQEASNNQVSKTR